MKKSSYSTKPKFLPIIAAAIMYLLCFSAPAWANGLSDGENYTLSIVHTNDIHGHVDDLPKYSTIIKQIRTEAKNLLVLDGGDIFLRGEFSDLNGVPEMKMLNAIGYDAWVIGNNDFRVPKAGKLPANDRALSTLIQLSNADTICANVTYKENGKLLNGVKPYIIKDVNGIKVAIIGLTSMKPQKRNYEPDKIFLNAADTLKKTVKDLEGKSDVNIVLSHCGLSVDVGLSHVPGISAVIGADDHFRMENPIYRVWKGQKSTPIVQHGGEENTMLGRLDLVFQKQAGQIKLVDFQGKSYDTKFVANDQNVQAIINEYRSINQKKSALGNAA